MKRRILIAIVVVLGLAVVCMVGLALERRDAATTSSVATIAPLPGGQADSGSGASNGAASQKGMTASTPEAAAPVAGGAAAPTASRGNTPATPVSQPLIVTTATLGLRVDDVPASVEALRKIAAGSGAQVSDLTYQSGASDVLPIEPLAGSSRSSGGVAGQPSSAQVTLRVPAAKLDEVTRQAAALGVVLSQTSNQSDVTAQHVDMAARLKNLRAEEARLRSLFDRAGSVSDLLEVEQELASVRGDIESAQAQLAYLDSQVAMSTLVVSLTQPGSVVRPAFGASWGIADAVTAGVQSAAALVRAFITGAIALLPLGLLVLLAWGAVRLTRRLRHKPAGDDAPAHNDAENSESEESGE